MTLAITAIVAAAALATIAFAVPQQVMAGGHRHHNSNSIRVDQQVNQANLCSTDLTHLSVTGVREAAAQQAPESNTVCANIGSNNATIGH